MWPTIPPAGVQALTTISILRPKRSFHCRSRLLCDHVGQSGALVVLVAVQLSVPGSYLPPVFSQGQHDIRPKRSFHCRSILPCDRLGQWARWWCWWLSNYPCWDCISRRCCKLATIPPHTIISLPVQTAVCRFGQWARWWCWWLSNYPCRDCISRRCSRKLPSKSAPDDHFTAGPDCGVNVSGSGRVGGAGGCPTIRAGIVSPAGVQMVPPSYPPQTIISLPVQTAV